MNTGKYIAEYIYANRDKLAEEITRSQQPERADVSPKFGMTFGKYVEYARHDLHQLAEALIAGDSGLFSAYKVWQQSMMLGHRVPTFFVQMNMDAEQAALKKFLPEDHHELISGYFNDAATALQQAGDFSRVFTEETGTYGEMAKQYLGLLLSGDRKTAGELVMKAVEENSIGIPDLYLKVFHPVMYEVGRLWQTGQITVAHEHFCSAATQLIMSELYPRIRKLSPKQDKLAVAACVAGELHEIGLRMSADLLEMAGWRTMYIGANTPAASIIDIAREQKAQALALSMCLPSNGPALRDLIAAARQELGEDIKIIIGGYILAANPQYAASFQADGVVKKAGEAPEVLNRLMDKAATNAGQ